MNHFAALGLSGPFAFRQITEFSPSRPQNRLPRPTGFPVQARPRDLLGGPLRVWLGLAGQVQRPNLAVEG